MSYASEQTARSMEDFRGDFKQLATVMEASWAESATAPFLYSADFLADCFRYPGSDFSLAPTIYHDSTPVAFVAGFPRRVRIFGKEFEILIVSLLTVASDHKNKGYGIVVWSELVRRARVAGFHGVVNYCVEGEAMNGMIEGSCSRLGLPVVRAHSASYLSRMLWPKGSVASECEGTLSVDSFLAAAGPIAAQVPFSRVWSRDEAAWQCSRLGALAAYERAPAGEGVLTGYLMAVANRDRTPCLLVEDVLWGTLDESGREALARRLIAGGTAAGARIAIVPVLGYAEMEPFLATGFRPSQRTVHAYLTIWSDPIPDEPLAAYYLDVL